MAMEEKVRMVKRNMTGEYCSLLSQSWCRSGGFEVREVAELRVKGECFDRYTYEKWQLKTSDGTLMYNYVGIIFARIIDMHK